MKEHLQARTHIVKGGSVADGAGEVISDLGLMKGNDWIVLRLNMVSNNWCEIKV